MKPLSASHIEKWLQCPRREAFIYRAGIREPSSPAADAGHSVHGVLEGKDPVSVGSYPIAEMAARIAAQAPLLAQQEYEFTLNVHGIDFTGRVDGKTHEPVTVVDFKTTSRVKYVKTPKKLSTDVQRLLYVEVEPTAVETLWLYGVWSDLSVHPVRMLVDRRKDAEKFKLHVLKPAEEILSVAEDIDPLSLPANEASCGLFPPAGCPFKSKCFPEQTEMVAVMSNLLENLRAEQGTTVLPPEGDVIPGPGGLTLDRAASAEFVNSGTGDPRIESAESVTRRPVFKAVPTKPIGTLYVDCYPVQISAQVTHAAGLISAAAESVANDAHVPHALLVDYGKGGPMIAAQLAHDLKGKYYEHIVLETRSAEGKACLFKLMELSETVVRGMI